MLNKIISFSVDNKLVIGLFTLSLIFFGAYQATKLPIDAVPDITDNQVQVITITPALGAPDVERLITFPIEQANSNIPGLKEIRSFSRFGLSLVTIVFTDETDLYWARQQVSERLLQVQSKIPSGIGSPELAPVTTGLGEIYQYVIKTKPGFEEKYDLTELRTIQDWIVRRQLLGTPGVADVSSFGGKLKQYEVSVNTDKLNAYHVTIGDVCKALENNNNNTGGAYIEKGPSVLFIRTEGLMHSINDVENIAVKIFENGVPLLLKDVGTVGFGSSTRYGAMCYNDEGEVAGAVVMMLKGANSSDVIKNVKKRIEEIKKNLPEGIVIEPFLDRTKMVNNAIGTVEKNLMEGALIVLFVLVLFLGNFRAGIIVASVIPLSMLFAIILMNIFGVSGNLMSLGALDFGLIVDGAVIIVEAVMHQITHSKKFHGIKFLDQHKMNDEVKSSASRMMGAAVFGQIIILIVYLPILSLQGIEGKMFKPMAQTVSFALLGAFILSLTYVPMVSSLMLSKNISRPPNISDRMMFKLERWYEKTLSWTLNKGKIIIMSTLVAFAISIFIMSRLGGEFIPELEEGDFAVDTRVLTGSSLSQTIESTQKSAHLLLENFPEVEKIVTKIGSGEIPTDPMPIEASDMMVILKPKAEWTNAKTFDELAEKMSERLSTIPGITVGFQYPVQMRFNELMTGARQDVVCKIFGENLDTLANHARILGQIIGSIDGAKDLYVESVMGMPQIVINYKRETLSAYGLSVTDINEVVNAAFAGKTTGSIFEDEKRFDLTVRLGTESRKDVSDIRNLLVLIPSGLQLPLSTFAEINIIDGPNQIQREDAKRRIVVGFNVRGKDVESVVNELKAACDRHMKLPSGYFISYSGSFENMNAAKSRLAVAVPISLFLILLLLYFAFKSVKQGLIIFSAIPLSAIGGIFALYFRGLPFSISAGIGFIALFGVAVLNGIVLISEFNRLQKEGWHDARRVVLMGSKIRLRPVLMTAAVASLGFLPMALSNGAGAEVQRPLATVVIGGLITATILTLFILPILYQFKKRERKKVSVINAQRTIVIALIMLIVPGIASSQIDRQRYSLEELLASVEENNLEIASSRKEVEYRSELSKIKFDPGRTTLGVDYGQFNTSLSDSKFSAQQSIALPPVYSAQHNLLVAEKNQFASKHHYTRIVAKQRALLLFLKWQLTNEKLKIINETDSLLLETSNRVSQRVFKGDAEQMDRLMAENQLFLSRQEVIQLKNELHILESELQNMAGFKVLKMPEESKYKMSPFLLKDSLALSVHPLIGASEFQLKASEYQIKIQEAKKLPELILGYNNMSIRGWETLNGSDIFHLPQDRFSWISLGVQLPILPGAYSKRIKAEEIRRDKYLQELNIIKQRLVTDYGLYRFQYENALKNIQEVETSVLPNVNLMVTIGNQKLNEGEINMIQWIAILNQAYSSKIDYLDAVSLYNESAIMLQSIIQQ